MWELFVTWSREKHSWWKSDCKRLKTDRKKKKWRYKSRKFFQELLWIENGMALYVEGNVGSRRVYWWTHYMYLLISRDTIFACWDVCSSRDWQHRKICRETTGYIKEIVDKLTFNKRKHLIVFKNNRGKKDEWEYTSL